MSVATRDAQCWTERNFRSWTELWRIETENCVSRLYLGRLRGIPSLPAMIWHWCSMDLRLRLENSKIETSCSRYRFLSTLLRNTPLGNDKTAFRSTIGTAGRQNNFHAEADLPDGLQRITPADYTGSGYDRGHMCNSKDRTRTNKDNSETFSMANMQPQTPDLNRHVWEKLEADSRKLAMKGNTLSHPRRLLWEHKAHRKEQYRKCSQELLEA